ncbi:hypothetical protein PPSIR1_13790 [Plesiocystis pacifica SIR-1]|uniref:Uncharacterized protein n=1 Tax=Plesiocystis pacifica SIR-1 TaxID=391625 RepID=A6GK19_9BACT|nr:hypothetical protein [Plesiocystis pacifica]EDM73780.1 hypothetical protein PPSIR1_13790 [Plesiocystis pacifica SIR-1]
MFKYVAICAGLLGMVSFLLVAWSLWSRGQKKKARKSARGGTNTGAVPVPTGAHAAALAPGQGGEARTMIVDMGLDPGPGESQRTAFVDMGEMSGDAAGPGESQRTAFVDMNDYVDEELATAFLSPEDIPGGGSDATVVDSAPEGFDDEHEGGPTGTLILDDLVEEMAAPPASSETMILDDQPAGAPGPGLRTVVRGSMNAAAGSLPSAPAMATPRAPAMATPRAPVAATPRAPAMATPRAPVAATPRAPAMATPRAPVAATPRAPAMATPRMPATPKPRAPVSPKPRMPVAAKPSAPATPKPRLPGVAKPSASATPKPRMPVSPKPRMPVAAKPKAPVAPKPSGSIVPSMFRAKLSEGSKPKAKPGGERVVVPPSAEADPIDDAEFDAFSATSDAEEDGFDDYEDDMDEDFGAEGEDEFDGLDGDDEDDDDPFADDAPETLLVHQSELLEVMQKARADKEGSEAG